MRKDTTLRSCSSGEASRSGGGAMRLVGYVILLTQLHKNDFVMAARTDKLAESAEGRKE